MTFKSPLLPLDAEGLTVDGNGAFLIATERHAQLLRVTPDRKTTAIVVPLEGKPAEMLTLDNAGLEGVTLTKDGNVLIAVERQPRGLIELGPDGKRKGIWSMPATKFSMPPNREPDFADLTTFGGEVYALERNAHLVVRLERTEQGWEEREAWSFAQTENDPRLSYTDRTYGMAEGLAIDDKHVYLVLDNNRLPRTSPPVDKRPQLFIFQRPESPAPVR